MKKIYNIPLIGYFFKLFVGVITLPKKIEWLRRIEKNLTELSLSTDLKFDTIEHELELKADKSTLDLKFDTIEHELELKADKLTVTFGDNYLEDIQSFLSEGIKRLPKSFKDYKETEEKDLSYLLFENVFYDHDIVKEKQKCYIPFIKKINTADMPPNTSWLDIGCGRGEFLNILNRENIKSLGVEINLIEYNELIRRGFSAYNDDAVSFLKKTEEKFMGISALQVVEHLEDAYLHNVIELAFLKIQGGGLIILETVNPYSFVGLANFYMDETHKKPIPPYRLAFLLEWYGFKNVKILYSALLPENFRNIDPKYNYQDYAVIGEKS